MSLRDFCVALLAGSVGVGGTVAVHKADAPKPAIERKARPKPVRAATGKRSLQVAPSAPVIFDCPLPSVSVDSFLLPGDVTGAVDSIGWRVVPPVDSGWWTGGGDMPPPSPPPVGAVPEPAIWAMMIAGYGLIGVAVRRQRGTRRFD